ncbi:hypothetical protein JCM10908_007268 [Rhodotorula pacifica]|uniref:uncharacterized protein n=1 Tax=Rhodotorula pacifica TaxID=1495444 RepID=UPI00316CFB9F
MPQIAPPSGPFPDSWVDMHAQPPADYTLVGEQYQLPELVNANDRESPYGTHPVAAPRRSSTIDSAYYTSATLEPHVADAGSAVYAYGSRRSSSFGTMTSPLPFTMDSPASSAYAGHSLGYPQQDYISRSRPGSADTTPEMMPSSCGGSALLPSAMIENSPLDFGARRDSLDQGPWSSRARWTAEQTAYRDVGQDPLAVEEIAPDLLAPSSARNPFAPNSSASLHRSTSAYSMSSSSNRTAQSGPYVRPITPGTSPREDGGGVRRRSIASESAPSSPSKRASPRKVAAVTTTYDANGSPTKSIRRIAKLNLDASPSSRSPSVSPRKGARRQPARIAPAESPRTNAQNTGQPGPARRDGSRSGRRVSFGGVEHVQVPSVLLPADPITLSVSGITLSPEDLALLDEATLLTSDELPDPRAEAPSWPPSFDLPTPPDQFYRPSTAGEAHSAPLHQPSVFRYEAAQPPSVTSFTLPANPHARAHSAYGDALPSSHATGLTMPAAPYPPPASPFARRRSSTASYDFVPVSSQRYPVPSSPWSPGFAAGFAQGQQPSQYSQQPRTFKLPAYGSSSASSSSPSPASDSRPVTPPPVAAVAPIVIPTSAGYPAAAAVKVVEKTTPKKAASPKASPKKKRSPTKSKRQPGAMFINYSSQDANKLLNGVAPSGSTRKRREEEEARRRAAIEAKNDSSAIDIGASSASQPHSV